MTVGHAHRASGGQVLRGCCLHHLPERRRTAKRDDSVRHHGTPTVRTCFTTILSRPTQPRRLQAGAQAVGVTDRLVDGDDVDGAVQAFDDRDERPCPSLRPTIPMSSPVSSTTGSRTDSPQRRSAGPWATPGRLPVPKGELRRNAAADAITAPSEAVTAYLGWLRLNIPTRDELSFAQPPGRRDGGGRPALMQAWEAG